MTAPPVPGPQLKAALRRQVLERRRAVHAARHVHAAADLAQRVAGEIHGLGNKIAGYWPIGEELDCRPALAALRAAGAEVALPVVEGPGEVLFFRTWHPGDPLDSGPFGTSHPSRRAAVIAPTILLLPVLAFDHTGQRLGYGAGYYDRTIAALRRERTIVTVGLAYDEQEVDAVPVGRHDQSMDAVITDRRTLWFNPAAKARLSGG